MPMYDFKCKTCDHVFESLEPCDTDSIPCEVCSQPTEKVWVSHPASVIGDECDYIAENLGPEPIRIRSKSERRRIMAERGLEECIRHVGVPGSDKSPHTRSWAAIGPETLANARALLERVGGVIPPSEEQTARELDDAVHTGEVGVEFDAGSGRSIGLRIGSVYHGTLDPAVLKGLE